MVSTRSSTAAYTNSAWVSRPALSVVSCSQQKQKLSLLRLKSWGPLLSWCPSVGTAKSVVTPSSQPFRTENLSMRSVMHLTVKCGSGGIAPRVLKYRAR
jgi:hypothetical protein